MSRSQWKGCFISRSLLNEKKILKKKEIIVRDRHSSIPLFLLGKYVSIYTGRVFIRIYISREKIGFKFGDFVFTRRHNKKVKKSTKPKKKK